MFESRSNGLKIACGVAAAALSVATLAACSTSATSNSAEVPSGTPSASKLGLAPPPNTVGPPLVAIAGGGGGAADGNDGSSQEVGGAGANGNLYGAQPGKIMKTDNGTTVQVGYGFCGQSNGLRGAGQAGGYWTCQGEGGRTGDGGDSGKPGNTGVGGFGGGGGNTNKGQDAGGTAGQWSSAGVQQDASGNGGWGANGNTRHNAGGGGGGGGFGGGAGGNQDLSATHSSAAAGGGGGGYTACLIADCLQQATSFPADDGYIRITFKRQSGPPAPPKVEANSPVLRQTPPGSCADITTADGFSEMVRFSDPEGNGCMAEMVSTCQSQDKGQNDDPKWIVLTKPVDVTIDVWGGKGGNTASHGTTYHGGNGGYVRYQGQISGTINGWVGCAGGDGKDGDGSFGGGGGGASSLVTATSFTTNGWAS